MGVPHRGQFIAIKEKLQRPLDALSEF